MENYRLTLFQIQSIVASCLNAAGSNLTKGQKQNLQMISDGVAGRLLDLDKTKNGEVSEKLLNFLNDKNNKTL